MTYHSWKDTKVGEEIRVASEVNNLLDSEQAEEVIEKLVSKGDRFKCEECGVVVFVDDPCGCAPCDLVCCGVAMKPIKAAKKKKKK